LRFRSFPIIANSLFLLLIARYIVKVFVRILPSVIVSLIPSFALLRAVLEGTGLVAWKSVKKYMLAVIRISPRAFDSFFRLSHTFWWMAMSAFVSPLSLFSASIILLYTSESCRYNLLHFPGFLCKVS